MVKRRISLILSATLFGLSSSAFALATGSSEVHRDGARLLWSLTGDQAHRLRLTGPDGQVDEFVFAAGEPVQLEGTWLDGVYLYELLDDSAGVPPLYRSEQEQAEGLAGRGTISSDAATTKARVSGHFTLQGRRLLLPNDAPEPAPKRASDSSPLQTRDSTRDQVIADDLIVQGSICVGFDCVNNESFGFDTLRLKENNTRVHFLDTSTAAGFPARSWELTANDSASGGLDYFAIHDRGTNARPFWVRSDAPSHSLFVDTTGRIGMGTSVPAMKLHLSQADTPGLRLQQGSGGFGSYLWDLAGNEANFFIRDVSSGGTLPLRVQPGTQTNTLTLNKNGNVGIGLWDNQAVARLDIHQAHAGGSLFRIRTGALASPTLQMELNGAGDLYIGGTLTQLSSRHAKANFRSIDGSALLGKVAELPISVWNYLHQPEQVRHLGPTAEDFHAAFGLGEQPTQIAPSDLAGVALAAVQVLTQELAERDRQVQTLEARLQQLEQRLLGDGD